MHANCSSGRHRKYFLNIPMPGIAKGNPLCRFKEGAQDAKHPSKGTIGFHSEKKIRIIGFSYVSEFS